MDHIIAIVLGGHPWDYRNLQALCEKCHKLKTKSDIKILAYWRRLTRYDPTFIKSKDEFDDNQTLLEDYQ